MVFALVLAYLFLVAQYESWSAPVSVILSVVVTVFGAVAPLVMLPFLDNNLYAQIGMVMLIGLASKNAILIVEFAKVRHDAGAPAPAAEMAEAAVTAARLCLRVVVMPRSRSSSVSCRSCSRAARGRRAGSRSGSWCSAGWSRPRWSGWCSSRAVLRGRAGGRAAGAREAPAVAGTDPA